MRQQEQQEAEFAAAIERLIARCREAVNSESYVDAMEQLIAIGLDAQDLQQEHWGQTPRIITRKAAEIDPCLFDRRDEMQYPDANSPHMKGGNNPNGVSR